VSFNRSITIRDFSAAIRAKSRSLRFGRDDEMGVRFDRDDEMAGRGASVQVGRSGSVGITRCEGSHWSGGEVEHLFGRDDVVEGFAPVDRRA
jgi:hypothetical protein